MVSPCPGPPSWPCWKNFLFHFFLAICMMLVLFTCYWIMKRLLSLPRTRRRIPSGNNLDEPSTQLQSTGLASAVIRSLPAIRFRKGMEEGDGHGSNDCAICLGKFHEGEWLRVLPNCDHVFHVYCIDPWLRSHSTCPLCRTNVLYDFNDPNSSVSLVVSLETLQREDAHQERALAGRLLQSEMMRNLESGMGAMSGRPYETESDESFQRRTVEELPKIAHNDNGESSSRDLGFNNEDHIYAQRPLARVTVYKADR